MLKVEGVVVGVWDVFYMFEGKKIEKYILYVGDLEGGDFIEIGCKVNGWKFGDKVVFLVWIFYGKNGKIYLNEIVKK